jgi:hypothetical protein
LLVLACPPNLIDGGGVDERGIGVVMGRGSMSDRCPDSNVSESSNNSRSVLLVTRRGATEPVVFISVSGAVISTDGDGDCALSSATSLTSVLLPLLMLLPLFFVETRLITLFLTTRNDPVKR